MLQTDVKHDFKTTFYGFWDQTTAATIAREFEALEADGRASLAREGLSPSDMRFERSGDFRYQGQDYVLTIPVEG